eukprot:9677866-Alexandrium_andersonii.AAC.1
MDAARSSEPDDQLGSHSTPCGFAGAARPPNCGRNCLTYAPAPWGETAAGAIVSTTGACRPGAGRGCPPGLCPSAAPV